MQLRTQLRFAAGTVLLFLAATPIVNGADLSDAAPITIGGVVFTDVRDPIRSGLEGVTVSVKGKNGSFQATTGSVIGLWKVDVPEGTYTVTPRKKDFVIEHLVGMGSDGQRSITIEVDPENMAANQSIRFLAVEWPEEEAVSSEIPDSGQTGGGCAVAHGGHSKVGDFFAPYAACLSVLLIITRVDSQRNSRRDRQGRKRRC